MFDPLAQMELSGTIDTKGMLKIATDFDSHFDKANFVKTAEFVNTKHPKKKIFGRKYTVTLTIIEILPEMVDE